MMLRKLVAIWIVVALVSLGVVGCSDDSQDAPPPEQLKTAEEYQAEAQEQITEENVADELDKLEQEISLEADQ
ncbi:hypothetical protein [Anaerobaca lacustris]|uniref:Secreted protein n=1 Tax=Anaerobaca lacustris TaxID=3044600 RepID=A0AAW6U443_9BACT|nr:hypothetical protein [Sedimentisphaerales bacterium M17dextr]